MHSDRVLTQHLKTNWACTDEELDDLINYDSESKKVKGKPMKGVGAMMGTQ